MKHLIIPDTQVKEGVSTDHLRYAGLYAAEKKPEVIVHIGDHWDLPSLSAYDVGKKSAEGRRYSKDIEAGNAGMDAFMAPIKAEQKRQRRNKKTVWKPRMVFCIGNHEYRIVRACEEDAKYDGIISYDDFNLDSYGSHYFTSGVMGRPVSSARAMVTKKMMSCVMGHVQDRDIAYARRGDGTSVTGLFAGIFYPHDEDYLNPQTNASWRGLWMLHEVVDGAFDELPVSLSYLTKKYKGL